ncbi:hypothetical protein ASZ90_016528 [hydrocarbon metagenome]|uniref:Uncharacterized protein n=1 Tax=hydrocarbon metagenome TaxID=938273 RepID=A0A0W8EPW2_9ZZZZ
MALLSISPTPVLDFSNETHVRGFHQGYLRPNSLICVSFMMISLTS